MKITGFVAALALAGSLQAAPATAVTREEATIQNATLVLRELQGMPDLQIPDLLLNRAEGLMILPGTVKVGLGLGARFGNGVLLVRRSDGSWSNPVFVNTGAGSIGWQFGGQLADIVLVFTTRSSVEGVTGGKITLGADASVAAGPVGRTAMASTSLTFDAEIYAYSRTKGLFAGLSLEGSGIFVSNRANRRFYGRRMIPSDIIGSRDPPPAPATELVGEVRRITAATVRPAPVEAAPAAAPEAAPPAEARTYPMPDPEPGAEPR